MTTQDQVLDKILEMPTVKANLEHRGGLNSSDAFELNEAAQIISEILNKTDKYNNDYPRGIWMLENYELRQILREINLTI